MIQNLITFIQVLKINSRRTNHLIQFLPIFQINISKTTPKTQTHNPTPTPDTHTHTHTHPESHRQTPFPQHRTPPPSDHISLEGPVYGAPRNENPTKRSPHIEGAPPEGEGAAGGGGARQGVAGGRMCARLQDAGYFGTRSAGWPGYFGTGYFWMFRGGGTNDGRKGKKSESNSRKYGWVTGGN